MYMPERYRNECQINGQIAFVFLDTRDTEIRDFFVDVFYYRRKETRQHVCIYCCRWLDRHQIEKGNVYQLCSDLGSVPLISVC